MISESLLTLDAAIRGYNASLGRPFYPYYMTCLLHRFLGLANRREQLPITELREETLREETLRVETLREETLRVETLRVETLRVETLRVETLRVETLRVEEDTQFGNIFNEADAAEGAVFDAPPEAVLAVLKHIFSRRFASR